MYDNALRTVHVIYISEDARKALWHACHICKQQLAANTAPIRFTNVNEPVCEGYEFHHKLCVDIVKCLFVTFVLNVNVDIAKITSRPTLNTINKIVCLVRP